MSGITEVVPGVPQPDKGNTLSDYPLIKPPWDDLCRAVAFTVQARRGQTDGISATSTRAPSSSQAAADEVFDFTAGFCEDNRRDLERALSPLKVTWLSLEHEDNIVDIRQDDSGVALPLRADGAIVSEPGTAVAFTTADCLPIILASESTCVMVGIHAGWKSLAAGIIEGALHRLEMEYDIPATDIRVWIGPAIAREDYEISAEVREALLARPAVTPECFTDTKPGHFLADLPMAAKEILISLGVGAERIDHHPLSTRQDIRLHSARRDSGRAGRMATVVGVAM